MELLWTIKVNKKTENIHSLNKNCTYEQWIHRESTHKGFLLTRLLRELVTKQVIAMVRYGTELRT